MTGDKVGRESGGSCIHKASTGLILAGESQEGRKELRCKIQEAAACCAAPAALQRKQRCTESPEDLHDCFDLESWKGRALRMAGARSFSVRVTRENTKEWAGKGWAPQQLLGKNPYRENVLAGFPQGELLTSLLYTKRHWALIQG